MPNNARERPRMAKEFTLDREVYTAAALQQARKDFASLCQVTVRPTNAAFHVTITPLTETPYLADEFLNYALGISIQELLT